MWIDRALLWLFPTLLLQSTPWRRLWLEKERSDFLRVARILYPGIAVAYILHFYLFDRPMQLAPEEHWFYFRMSMAGLSASTFLFYASSTFTQIGWYKLPAMITGAVVCYFQARVLVWYEESVYFYAFGFVIVASILLRMGIAQSLMYSIVLLAIQWTTYLEAGVERPLIYSATVITLIFVALARSSYSAEIRYFRASQENIENQKKMIELNIEFTDRLRAFLPKEISRRLFGYVESQRMSILQAIEEVLRPKHKQIACLFSDIRGFTKSTQAGQSFVNEGVIPNVRKCTRAVELHGGIPRKVGDLIFAYFDDIDVEKNVLRCVSAAIDLVDVNNNFNSNISSDVRINRHVLVASGPAVVGNLGGFDSSIEITALGNPVNLLSRIDELVKHPKIRIRIATTDIVLDNNTASVLARLVRETLPLRPLHLPEIGVSIRDFEAIPLIWLLKVDDAAKGSLERAINRLEGAPSEYTLDSGKEIQAVRT